MLRSACHRPLSSRSLSLPRLRSLSLSRSTEGRLLPAGRKKGSPLSSLKVNSFHHQAVKAPGSKFRVVATATDGIIEAIESTEFKSILGVQWHPECLETGLPLFQWLVGEASAYRQAHHTTVS